MMLWVTSLASPRRPLKWGDRLGIAASQLVRRCGRSGGIIAGRIALAADPDALPRLAAERSVALVSGTNGKSTTTVMLAAAWSTGGAVATNVGGANMPDGLVAALLDRADAGRAALEVDEPYLPRVLRAVNPAVVVLLNLSRDQLDRVLQVGQLAGRIGQALRERPESVVVANADDPSVVAAAQAGRRTVWVSGGGAAWTADAAACPSCGALLVLYSGGWRCDRCPLRRPQPDWELRGERLTGPGGQDVALRVGLPGRINRSNAAFVVAAADALGVPMNAAVDAIAGVREVHGRYRVMARGPHQVRLLLAKNPAGWQEMLDFLAGGTAPIVLAVNSRPADGRDPSWLWDVPFERLGERQLVAAGDRAEDLSVRLTYAGLAHTMVPDPISALGVVEAGQVDLVGDYTSVLAAARRLQETDGGG
jgi:UDP-N-acetylmuramyl tripeptide synthase